MPRLDNRVRLFRDLYALTATAGLLVGQAQLFAADAETAALFVKHCASCHGRDGKAQTPVARKLGVKDLTISRIPDAEIERQILEGNKDKQGNQRMPPFKQKLASDEIQRLAAWAKSLRK